MRIITVNVSISDLNAIDKYVGANQQFPSRSEFIRAAIFDWLQTELEPSQNFINPQEAADKEYVQAHANSPEQKAEIDQSLVIRVPAGKIDEDGIYKMYRIVKK